MKAVDLVTRMMMVVPDDAASALLSKLGPTHDVIASDGTPLEHKTTKVEMKQFDTPIIDSASHVPLFKSAALQPSSTARYPLHNRKARRRALAKAKARQRAKQRAKR